MARFRKRRTYYRKRRFSKYKRSYRRGRGRYRRSFRKSRNTLHVRRAANVTTVTTSAGLEYDGAMSFNLNECFSAGEFTGLFDQYRINAVVLKFIPDFPSLVSTDTNVNPSTGLLAPNIHWCIDINDAIPATIGSLAQYNGYHVKVFNRPMTIKIRPRASAAYYQSAIATAYGPAKPRTWFDTNSPNLPHYGFKFVIDTVSGNQIVRFRIRPIYYVSLKQTK